MAAMDTNSRDEIVGHCTLCVLALLGMALYSLTYSLVYMGSDSTPVTAVLEMWMITTHLISAATCCIVQILFVSVLADFLDGPIHQIAEAQTALFLGIAMAVTILGNSCIQANNTGAECGIYFGAAALPRISAAGTAAWSWVMYISSLGCQQWSAKKGKLLSLGIGGLAPLTVTATMLLLPLLITSKLSSTCGGDIFPLGGWSALVCSNNSYVVDSNNNKSFDLNSSSLTTTTTTTDCSNLSTGKTLGITTLVIGLFLAWGGNILSSFSKNWSKIPSILGTTFMMLGPLCVWATQGNASIVPPVSYHVTATCFSAITFVSELWQLIPSSATSLFPSCCKTTCLSKKKGKGGNIVAGTEAKMMTLIMSKKKGTKKQGNNTINNSLSIKMMHDGKQPPLFGMIPPTTNNISLVATSQPSSTIATQQQTTQARFRQRLPYHLP